MSPLTPTNFIPTNGSMGWHLITANHLGLIKKMRRSWVGLLRISGEFVIILVDYNTWEGKKSIFNANIYD
jgi:hypothetical protein